jgi:hypothetical protein
MKKICILCTSLLLSPSLFAQAPGVAVELSDEAGLGSPANSPQASDLARDLINSKGWIEGYDPDKGTYIAVGVGPIPVGPSHPSFGQARVQAFKRAIIDVKEQMARYMAAEVSREITSIYEEPNVAAALAEAEVEAAKQPGVVDKAEAFIHAELDRLLNDRGVDMSTPEVVQKEVSQLILSDSFSDVVNAAARAEVAGLQVYHVIEAASTNTGEVAVIAIFSKKSKQMAAALLGKAEAPTGKAKSSISSWIKSLEAEKLISTHGIKPRVDENGNLNLVAFGQSFPRSSSSMALNGARNKARVQAMGYLRSFAGEMVATRESAADASSFQEFANGSQEFLAEDSYEKMTQTRAASLKMPGIVTVHSWSEKDTRNGKPVVGTVLAWNLGNAKQANVLREQMNSLGGSRGGKGVTAKPKRPSHVDNSSTSKMVDESPYVKQGISVDDDDF